MHSLNKRGLHFQTPCKWWGRVEAIGRLEAGRAHEDPSSVTVSSEHSGLAAWGKGTPH